MDISLLLYGSEVWVPNTISNRIQSAKLTFLSGLKLHKISVAYIQNEDIENKWRICSIYDTVQNYRSNSKQQLNCMYQTRLLKLAHHLRSSKHRHIGRAKKYGKVVNME